MSWIRWLPLLVIVLFSGLFAYFNGGERITLNLGVATVYRVSLVSIVFAAFVLGMVSMFLVGLRQDIRLRRQLRERGLLDERPLPREEPSASEWGAPR